MKKQHTHNWTFGKHILWHLVIPLLAVTFAGCAFSKKYGDGILVDRKDIVWAMFDELRFQSISLKKTGISVYKIRNLPIGILPTAYYIEVPALEASKYLTTQPWRKAVVVIEAIDMIGQVLYTQKIDFAVDWKGASVSGRGERRKIWISATDWRKNLPNPRFTSYDLRVTVVSPSERSTDTLLISAMTRIQGDFLY